MTYFGFLFQYILLPLLALSLWTWADLRRGKRMPPFLRAWSPWRVLGAHVMVAILYTTPWDNYLVATAVWWYDPALVTGWLIGWVPVEEYCFFVLQTLLTGLWWLTLARHFAPPPKNFRPLMSLRVGLTALGAVGWAVMAAILLINWQPGTYLALELTWALPPIMLQLSFGADILWYYRRLVLSALLPSTLYLCYVDALAIQSGTWTINPLQTVGLNLGGVLPLEEFLFFLLTNTLVIFGMTLVLAEESQRRAPQFILRRIYWLAG